MMVVSARLPAMLRSIALAFTIATALALPAHADGEKDVLAPTGKLRVGVYPGSPTSLVIDPATHREHGLSHDIGAELAKRLNVPVAYVTFPRVADVITAIKNAEVDFTVTNATPARANDVNFSPTLISVELGYLVPANSTISSVDDIDRPGIRVGVTKGSTSEKTLGTKFANAKVVPVESVKVAVAQFASGEIDLYATNKPTLYEISDSMPGARILEGRWGLEHMAVATPRGREQAAAFVSAFVKDVQGNGQLAQAQKDAGLRGAAKAE